MYLAVRREQRFPITEVLAETPAIPDGCQWGLFLRNHDELTLEMVTDDERDYLYAEYARDPRMKRNVGIARRLFPLLDNDRRVAELFHGMLFSLPGSPVLYYGDEIGMGDNIYLGDRDTVRTPMQWSPDRNAGFSRADFAQLYLPPLMDPVYGYEAINVEAGLRDQSSFLHWLQRMLQVRRQHEVFGTGSLEVLGVGNASVFAYLRRPDGAEQENPDSVHDDVPRARIVLCVNNLSRFAQPAEIALNEYAGHVPVEMIGRVPFPPIGELPYFITLPPYGFYWFTLVPVDEFEDVR
jgi:maltose alpha-D-glucosyltransferase/alpha-amylase